jgi:hypothetical protein
VLLLGRTIAQAGSHRLPTAAARVRAQVRSCGSLGEQSGIRQIVLRILRSLPPILIAPTAPHSSSTIQGWYNRPDIGYVPKRLGLTPPQETETKKLVLLFRLYSLCSFDVVVDFVTNVKG